MSGVLFSVALGLVRVAELLLERGGPYASLHQLRRSIVARMSLPTYSSP